MGMGTILLNDQFIEREQATVDIEDRGYQFGDGVYEVIRIYGGKMFTGKEHITRLFESAEKIFLQLPFTKQQLTDNLEQLVQKNNLDTGIIYLQVTRGVSSRQHQFPEQSEAVFTAYTKEVARPEKQLNEDIVWKIKDTYADRANEYERTLKYYIEYKNHLIQEGMKANE